MQCCLDNIVTCITSRSQQGGGELGTRLFLWTVYEVFLLLVAAVLPGPREDVIRMIASKSLTFRALQGI